MTRFSAALLLVVVVAFVFISDHSGVQGSIDITSIDINV